MTSPDLRQAKKLACILKVSSDELVEYDLEIMCEDKLDSVYKNLIGKTCQIEFGVDFFDMYLTSDTPVRVLEINSDFIKIEYEKKKEKCIKLIDIDLIVAIKVLLEG